MFKRRRKTLSDTILKNMSLKPGPAVRIPKKNTPRSMPRKTGEFFPVRQSKN